MREKAFRDPVHDFITLKEPLFIELIDTPEFQRLRRIRQLGASYGTYHGAEHSRFGHSLGVLWIMTRILDRFRTLGVPLDESRATVAKAAALLHDVGHGPFSHALEGCLTPGMGHEEWSRRILLGPSSLHERLKAHDAELPAQVAAVISGEFDAPKFITDLVSSQMDVDRMDYLLRDSLYTGVTYGRYDLTRLINTLQVQDDRIVCVAKGVGAVEEYLIARYFMYWQVYLHKTTRSHELTLQRLWRRAVDVWVRGELRRSDVPATLVPFLCGEPTLDEYLAVDDHDVLVAIKTWQRVADPILSDLSSRLLSRRLLKPVYKVPLTSLPHEQLPDVQKLLAAAGWDPEYYLLVDDVTGVAYDWYTPGGHGEPKRPILALDVAGRPREITQLSPTMRALASGPRVAVNLFVPAEVVADVRALLGAAPS